jgi:hypothetical protein
LNREENHEDHPREKPTAYSKLDHPSVGKRKTMLVNQVRSKCKDELETMLSIFIYHGPILFTFCSKHCKLKEN